jgi:hypothetical protein
MIVAEPLSSSSKVLLSSIISGAKIKGETAT